MVALLETFGFWWGFVGYVDSGVTTDSALRIIDLSKQRIRSNVCCVYVNQGVPDDGSPPSRVIDRIKKLPADVAVMPCQLPPLSRWTTVRRCSR